MGRVRKYKKVKNIDPFGGGGGAKSEKYDQPPSVWEGERKKSVKRYNKAFSDEDAFERMLQHEARRQIKIGEDGLVTSTAGSKKMKTVEGKKDSESMKQFKNRIREETSKTLRQEIGKMTSTAKKGKQFLIDKKNRKKGYGERVDDDKEVFEEGFSSRQDGHLRYSDLGGADTFDHSSNVKFGERVDQPPDFHKVAPLKLKGDGPMKVVKAAPNKHNRKNEASSTATSKKRKQNISDIVESNGDSGLGSDAFFSSGKSGVGGAKASAAELEDMREKVQAAYRKMRDKRHKF